MDSALVAAAAQPLVTAAEVDTVDARLVRPPPQLHELHPLGRVPDSYQGALKQGYVSANNQRTDSL